MPKTLTQVHGEMMTRLLEGPSSAIRTELRLIREGSLMHPPNVAAAIAIEAHLDEIVRIAGGLR